MKGNPALIADVINAIAVAIAVWLFNENLFVYFVVFMAIWLIVFRQGLMTITVAFLLTLAIDDFKNGQMQRFYPVAIILVVIVVIDLILLGVIPFFRGGWQMPPPAPFEVGLYALIGISIAYVIQMRSCQIPLHLPPTSASFTSVFYHLFYCQTQFLEPRINQLMQSNGSNWRAWTDIIVQTLKTAPWVWAILFACLRRANLNPLGGIRYLWRAFKGLFLAGMLTAAAWLVVFILISSMSSSNPIFASLQQDDNLIFLLLMFDISFSCIGLDLMTR